MAYTLLGQDFVPPDIRAKVTGEAKYAEDFRADGMVFCRLLHSTMPHARVTRIDASEALAMDGVVAVLTVDDLPETAAPIQPLLTNEPMFAGEPILAVAAVSETLAEDAIDRILVELEPLPFSVDPLDSLFPGGPNARSDGNVVAGRRTVETVKWTAADFASVEEGQLPAGEPSDEWSFGDVEGNMAEAAFVLDETFVTQNLSHNSLESRTCMAYWQNGKCYVHGSTQSQTSALPSIARIAGVEVDDLVYIAEYCGGGFGSKIGGYPIMGIAIHMARKAGRPVMLRVSRAEEVMLGSSRPCVSGADQDGFQRRRTAHGHGSLRRAAEWTLPWRRRLGLGSRCRDALVPARRDALPGNCRQQQHAADRSATRSGGEPDRYGGRAASRQGGQRTEHRPR